MPPSLVTALQIGDIVDEIGFSAEELARACGVAPAWVRSHVEAGVLQVDWVEGHGRYGSLTLLRARRIARLEASFDADPQLAALTADLIEEVTRLRRQLKALGG